MSDKRNEILKAYIDVCRKAATNEETFKIFKSIPAYKEVLEHLNYNLGQKHFDLILKNNPSLLGIARIWENDRYGKPEKFTFDLNYKEILSASPTTVQYLSVVSNLIDNFNSLTDFKIIEIGGGYGGQCKIIQDVFDIKSYDIIDLAGVTDLQHEYLVKLNCIDKVYIIESNDYEMHIEEKYDLAISNYAVSEVSAEDQLAYVKNIFLKCKHGYLTCNQPLNGMELLKAKFPTFKISKDIEGEREENYLITW